MKERETRSKRLVKRRFKMKLFLYSFLGLLLLSFWGLDNYLGRQQLITQKQSEIGQTVSSLDNVETHPVNTNHNDWKMINQDYQVKHYDGLTYVPLASVSTHFDSRHRMLIQRFRLYNKTKQPIYASYLFSMATGFTSRRQRVLKERALIKAQGDAEFDELFRETHGMLNNWHYARVLKPGQSVDLVILSMEAK